jgi:HEAT repeat protein
MLASITPNTEIDIDSLFAPAMSEAETASTRNKDQKGCTEKVDPLQEVYPALESPKASVRLGAVQTIGENRTDASLILLGRMLNDPADMVADTAADILVSRGRLALVIVEKLLFHSENPTHFSTKARKRVLSIAGRMPCTESEVVLRRSLDDDEIGDLAAEYLIKNLGLEPCSVLENKSAHWRGRVSAAGLLTAAKDQDSLILLYSQARDETNPLPVRTACLQALSIRNKQHNAEPFLAFLKDSACPQELRVEAALALAQTSEPAAMEIIRTYTCDKDIPAPLRHACQQVLMGAHLFEMKTLPVI